jgi:hypothetical protein
LGCMFTSCSLDVLRYIFAFCGEGILRVLRLVCRDTNIYITTDFTPVEYLQSTLETYGAQWGRLDIIRWDLDTKIGVEDNMIIKLYYNEMVKRDTWIQYIFHHPQNDTLYCICMNAVRYGHLEMVKFIYEKIPNIISPICMTAIECGHWEIFVWAYSTWKKTGDVSCTIMDVVRCAIRCDRLHIIQWAREIEPTSFDMEQCYRYAVKCENLEIFQWIISTGFIAEYETYYILLYCYGITTLKWVRKNDPNWNSELCYKAAALI